MKFLFNILILLIVFSLSSCGSQSIIKRKDNADSIAYSAGFTSKLVQGGKFLIYTYQKITNPTKPYVIYIEGDGSIISRGIISSDPTPRNHMLLELATIDNRPNVIYVARPCQYSIDSNLQVCNSNYWTSKRLSDDSVESINEVINKIAKTSDVDLVGFSGGGGIAILVAARNTKVKSVITIAGNLDHVLFNKLHNTSPMRDSLNPIDYVHKISNIPQLHLSGGSDNIVPPIIAKTFVEKSNSRCSHIKIISNFTHTKGWNTIWKDITSTPVVCY